jgi:hypothetical protein
MVVQRMPKDCNQCLGARIDSLVLAAEAEWRSIIQQGRWHELSQERFRDDKYQAGIAAFDGMTDLIRLTGIKKQHMVRIGDGLVTTDVTDINPSIREHELRF